MENNYRIKITRGDSEFEVQGDKEFVLEMLERFERVILEKSSPRQIAEISPHDFGSEAQDPSKVLSVGEYIRKINSK